MRAVVQRVSRASVTVAGDVVGRLDEPGLVVLVGAARDDTPTAAAAVARKIFGLRILRGERSAAELNAPLLVVSQFSLYADYRKGRRPSWHPAAPAEVAEPLVEVVVDTLQAAGARVQTGRFGAMMSVELVNDGPLTLVIDSAELGPAS